MAGLTSVSGHQDSLHRGAPPFTKPLLILCKKVSLYFLDIFRDIFFLSHCIPSPTQGLHFDMSVYGLWYNCASHGDKVLHFLLIPIPDAVLITSLQYLLCDCMLPISTWVST